MTTADTASIITAWPEEGLSYNDALKRAPMWEDSVNKAREERNNEWPRKHIKNFQLGPLLPEECNNEWLRKDIEDFQLSGLPRDECSEWLRKHLENGLLVVQGRDAQNDQPIQIRLSMVRHLHFNAITELMHGLGRTFYDLRVFAADKLKAAPKSSSYAEVDPFRTGAAGRPTASHLVVAEAKRRIEEGEVKPREGGLNDFANLLCKWWDTERLKYQPPGAPPLKPGSIKNAVRQLWNDARAVPQ
jgi:hypothetical protein